MNIQMKLWWMWTLLAAIAFVASAYTFLNFWAAVDLGYDTQPEGKAITARWAYGAFGCLVAGILCGVMARRARRRSS